MRIFGAEYTSHAMPTAVPQEGRHRGPLRRGAQGLEGRRHAALPRTRPAAKRFATWASIRGPAASCPWASTRTRSGPFSAVSADGKTVTLDRPLAYQHGDIYGYAEAVPVGNLSRNVVIESENVEDVSRRGHVMFMHTQDVVLDSVLFRELGRTNVEGTLTSPRVKDGKLAAGTDANTIGRYAVHFHIRWGATYKQQPFIVRNCAVVGSPKLGVVNHGGYGLVDDNVSYRVRGSHFFTENGSEIGRFKGNLAVRSNGTRPATTTACRSRRKYAYKPSAEHRAWRPRLLAARRRRGRDRQRRHRPLVQRLWILRRQQPHRHLRRPAGAEQPADQGDAAGSVWTSSWPRT